MKNIDVINKAMDELDQIAATLSIWNQDDKYFEHHSDCGRAIDEVRSALAHLTMVVNDHEQEMAREAAELMREAI